MGMFWFVFLLTCADVLSQPPYDVVDVPTEYGVIRGRVMTVDNGVDVSDIHVFQGVPYGKDTSGQRRYRKPERPEPFTELFEAFTIGDACAQNPVIVRVTNPGWDRFSENCLHLNIYTPAAPPSEGGYPVMVWNHGGGFTAGASFQYPGHFLATHGVIVVGVNYRLNKFGFAFCNKPECAGNQGMWDQILATHYVIDNIANFGGDPSRITLFGQAEGAASASLHILSPHSKDLFQAAIMQSGTEDDIILPDSEPEKDIYEAARSIDCPTDSEFDMMECLREPSWQQILYNTSLFGLGPSVDGGAYSDPEDGFLPREPSLLRKQGDIMSGPMIAAHNHDDGASAAVILAPASIFPGCCNRTYYEQSMRERVVPFYFGNVSDETSEKLYRALDCHYTPWPYLYNHYENKKIFVDIVTDNMFGRNWNKQIKSHQDVGTVYSLVYNYRGRNTTALVPEWLGVPHVAEIPYVFGYTLLPRNEHIANDSTVHFDLVDWTEEDIQQTIFIQTLWTNFAKYGNPTPTPVPNPLGTTTVWPEYTWGDLSVLVISNTSIAVEDGWRDSTYAFWDEYTPYVAGDVTVDSRARAIHADFTSVFGDVLRQLETEMDDVDFYDYYE